MSVSIQGLEQAKRLANAAENFAKRFSMNDLAEDDDRQRQAVLDQVKLFRAALEPLPASQPEVEKAAADVLAERRRQVEQEGWTPEHDDAHSQGELLRAAKAYFAHARGLQTTWSSGVPHDWPWEAKWWKPKSPREDLVRAGALALAETDRIERKYPQMAAHRIMDSVIYCQVILAEIERLDRATLNREVPNHD